LRFIIFSYKKKTIMLGLHWSRSVVAICDWPIKEESIVYYANDWFRPSIT